MQACSQNKSSNCAHVNQTKKIQIQPRLCFPNSWCQKADWRSSMSAKQKRRSETASNSTQVLAAPPPVIDHARPQVSNNLSWHFIQAADQRGSGISGAWSSELRSRPSTNPPLDVGKSSDQSSNQSSDQSLEAGRARIHRWMLGRAPIRRTRSAI